MSTNPTIESTGERSPRRKGRIRRFLRRVFYLIILLIGGFAIYAWATGARQDPIETGEPHMKAVVYTNYGSPDVLEVRDIKKPVPDDDQILIKVQAASINPLDWHYMEGTPYLMRAMGIGLRKPRIPRLGVDVAGEVEAVGKNVTQFKPGDEVFGGKTGALAEYRLRSRGPGRGAEAGRRDLRASRFSAYSRNHRVAGSSRQGARAGGAKGSD